VEDLEPESLIKKGIKGVIVDLDNTIAPRGEGAVPSGIREWIKRIQSLGIDVVLISNSPSSRTQKYAQELGLAWIANALKPLPMAFIRASKKMNIPLKSLAVVGDQVFTDVLGGNICGAFTVLVSPLSKKTDFFTTKFVRVFERFILRKFKKGGG
jgi:HAD superfamily phosphatase (TIGR01668 family)